MSKDHELLLPVGNTEMAMAAIHNGADAIYIGVPGFNARGRSQDFELADLKALIEACHLYGVKVNLALNILIFQEELVTVARLLEKIISFRPDAFIVQDLGLIRLIRQIAPDQAIHASTQMTVTNFEAIALLNDLNIRRFVLGRENSLSEIKLIRAKTNKDLEVFVHGALCVSYSGQCFTSESLGGRSANRGQCAQSCRFGYELYVDGERHRNTVDREYLVSPKDLCGIREIPELMDLGVKSFKIEGRLKSAEYVAEASRDYRSAIDAHAAGKKLGAQALGQKIKNMATTYSRGFFSGWLHGVNHQQLVEGSFSAHRGQRIGLIQQIRREFKSEALIVELDQELILKAGDGLVWSYKKSAGKELEAGAQVFEARKLGPRLWELKFSNAKKLEADFVGAAIYINSDSELNKELQKSFSDKNQLKRIPVTIQLALQLEQPLKAVMSDGKYSVAAETLSPLSLAQKVAVSDEFLQTEFASLGGTVFTAEQIQVERKSTQGLFCSHKEMKELRRELTSKLAALRSQNRVEAPGFMSSEQGEADKSDRILAPPPRLKSTEDWLQETSELFQKQTHPKQTQLNVLLREKRQVEDFVRALSSRELEKENLGAVILDFEFGLDFAPSVEMLKSAGVRVGIATTRILKPQEYLNLKVIERLQPDVILVRNLGALRYYTEVSPFAGELMGDFSLNVTNHLSAEYLLGKGLSRLCLSYDLNRQQVDEVLAKSDGSRLEVTVHQYMPSFHMEHCVFAAFLSKGTSFKDCGKPCEKHLVELRDQFGNNHQIKPDQECRNTMYNAVSTSAARFVPEWQTEGLGAIRFEALRERGQDLILKVRGYQDLLAGRKSADELVAQLHLVENYGLQERHFASDKKHSDRKKDERNKEADYGR